MSSPLPVALFLAALGLAGCPTPAVPSVEVCNDDDDDDDGEIDEGTAVELGCAADEECLTGECLVSAALQLDPVDSADVLLVVDNSSSMADEQQLLVNEIPRAIHHLVSGDLDDDGVPDVTPIASLHVGVVTTDLGAGPAVPPGETVPTCSVGFGGDGILRTTSANADCTGSYPSILDFAPGVTDPATYAADVGCGATPGTGGCGFEQQLEAALKALSPARPTPWVAGDYEPPLFAGMTSGHGDGTNDGFVREGTVLAIVLVTDEEDCSVPDYALFYRDPRFSSIDLNLRCFTFPEEVYPTDRYVEGFLQLREASHLLVYGAITGVPPDLVEAGQFYDAWLADPRMVEQVDPATMNRLLPACRTADDGSAFPARRIVTVGRDLAARGAAVSIGSICGDSFATAVDGLVEAIFDRTGGACLPRPIPTDAEGRIPCRLVETLPFGTTCDELPGRSALGTVRVGDSILFRCEIPQDAALGWSYDDSSPEVTAACGPDGQTIQLNEITPTGTVTIYCDPDAASR